MIVTVELLDTARLPTVVGDEDHFVCCFHHHVTLCDHYDPSTDRLHSEEPDEVSCVVCNDMVGSDYCPVYKHCPDTVPLD